MYLGDDGQSWSRDYAGELIKVLPFAPEHLESTVLKSVSFNPAIRYKTVTEMKYAILEAVEQKPQNDAARRRS